MNTHTTEKPNFEQTIALMKAEILCDIAIGLVPKTVESFSELHDYVDANCYGGFCNDSVADALIAAFGGRDADKGMPDGYVGFMNDAQNAVDHWLREGGHARANIDIDAYYHLQEYNPKGDNWIPRLGTRSLVELLKYKKSAEARGETVRCVVVVQHIIA